MWKHFLSTAVLFGITDSQNRRDEVPMNGITTILNKKECCVSGVSTTIFGRLCYRETWCFNMCKDITKVLFIKSKFHKENRYKFAVEADFDIYTLDGRIIAVHTYDRRLIEAAVKLAPASNIRSKYRAERG